MNRRPSELALVAVSLVCVLILAACNCAPTLRYITISPSGPITVPGAQVAFTATGYYSNGAITPSISVSWSSSTTSVATINGTSGVATGVAAGTTTITATALGITSGTTTLTVAPATSITVTPATTTISLTNTSANTVQYDAVANYSGGTVDVTQFATWAATTPSIATFSTATPGLATAAAAGTTPVTATLDGVVGTASLTVTNGVALVVTPASPNLAVGNSSSLTVQEQYPDMSLHPVTGPVTWSSATPAQANVVTQPNATNGSTAIVTGFSSTASNTPPTVAITATEGALSGAANVTVDQGTTTAAYASDFTGNIDYFSVNATTAPYLSGLVPTATSGYFPSQTVIDPNGQFLFLTSTNAGQTFVTPYTIGSGGALTAGTAVTMVNSADITYSAVDPYGRFLFVADENSPSTTPATPGGIYVYSINQSTGALTAVTGSPFTKNLNAPAGLAIDQSGTYLYASNFGNPLGSPAAPGTTIAGFTIDPNTGALTPLSTPTFTASPALSSPNYMAWDPTGTYLYVANNFANTTPTVTSFTLGANGALTQLTTTTVTGATAPLNVAVTPNGSFLYVLDGVGGLYGFTLSAGSPSTTAIAGSPFPTAGTIPTGIAIDPTSSILAVDNSDTSNISIYTINATSGVLTPQTPVSTGSSSRPFFVVFYNTF
ncbi:MAG TPA: beta-propeller fold lactonase family protein [Verrucomicrobiae bacterium]|nr:beta-propeller fold lactonase family protein [Verrucomicrobiae bacterium]